MSEPFEIASEEGLPIRGELDVASMPRALVLVVHGFKGFKNWGFFPWLGESLCAARFTVCRFNMSRSGIGENADTFERLDLFADDTYSRQLADLRAVVAHVTARFAGLPLFLLGHSRGGGVALLGAPEIEGLRGVITWSAIARVDRWDDATMRQWRREGHYDVMNARTKQIMRMSTAMLDDYEDHRDRLDILAAAGQLRVPLLAVHGAADESVPVAEAHEIVSVVPDASSVIIAGASHTYNAIHPLVTVPFHLVLAAAASAQFISINAR